MKPIIQETKLKLNENVQFQTSESDIKTQIDTAKMNVIDIGKVQDTSKFSNASRQLKTYWNHKIKILSFKKVNSFTSKKDPDRTTLEVTFVDEDGSTQTF